VRRKKSIEFIQSIPQKRGFVKHFLIAARMRKVQANIFRKMTERRCKKSLV
jgi:hypothetical protein